jgi:hypothetical protein
MSAAARPKRWGESRQAKGQELDPTKVEIFTLIDGAFYYGYLGQIWGGKILSTNGLRLMDLSWSQQLTLKKSHATL